MELAATASEIWAPSNSSTKSAWAWCSTLNTPAGDTFWVIWLAGGHMMCTKPQLNKHARIIWSTLGFMWLAKFQDARGSTASRLVFWEVWKVQQQCLRWANYATTRKQGLNSDYQVCYIVVLCLYSNCQHLIFEKSELQTENDTQTIYHMPSTHGHITRHTINLGPQRPNE